MLDADIDSERHGAKNDDANNTTKINNRNVTRSLQVNRFGISWHRRR
jgi:hypothetical protein